MDPNYGSDPKKHTVPREKKLEDLKKGFKAMTINEGKCAQLNIHDEEKGAEELINFFNYLILERIGAMNGFTESLVTGIRVAFT